MWCYVTMHTWENQRNLFVNTSCCKGTEMEILINAFINSEQDHKSLHHRAGYDLPEFWWRRSKQCHRNWTQTQHGTPSIYLSFSLCLTLLFMFDSLSLAGSPSFSSFLTLFLWLSLSYLSLSRWHGRLEEPLLSQDSPDDRVHVRGAAGLEEEGRTGEERRERTAEEPSNSLLCQTPFHIPGSQETVTPAASCLGLTLRVWYPIKILPNLALQ